MIRKIFFIIIALFIVSITVYVYVEVAVLPRLRAEKDADNPLRKSEEEIGRYLFGIIPIRTSMHDFIKQLEDNRDWKVDYKDGNYVLWSDIPKSESTYYISKYKKSKRVTTIIGKYRDFFTTCVRVIWIFDDNLELIEINVNKDVDAP